MEDIEVIYEDRTIMPVNKPALIDSSSVPDLIADDSRLIHRLDRETTGVLLLAKGRDFLEKAIDEFKNRRVKKRYLAWVEGIFFEGD